MVEVEFKHRQSDSKIHGSLLVYIVKEKNYSGQLLQIMRRILFRTIMISVESTARGRETEINSEHKKKSGNIQPRSRGSRVRGWTVIKKKHRTEGVSGFLLTQPRLIRQHLAVGEDEGPDQISRMGDSS